VIPGHREHRRPERPQELRRLLELVTPSAVRKIP
jgi:hypothetical protein